MEQTVEVPEDCITSDFIRNSIVGQVREIHALPAAKHTYHVVIGYSPELTAYQIPQFLNLFFGNISLKNFIRVVDVDLPECFLSTFHGPNYGIQGIRRLLGVYDRPLAATALKPMGSTPEQLAAMAESFALGGGDLIKDDHGLADHSFCTFQKRVEQCQAAVERANGQTGRNTLYFPNVLGSFEQMQTQFDFVHEQGVKGVLLSPFLVGPDMLRYFAAEYPLIFMAHPAFTGTHFHDRTHGIMPSVLLGTLFRLLGADVSVFPNHGGRFGFLQEECVQLAQALQKPLGQMKASFPGPAGGMTLHSIQRMSDQYGREAIYIIGGALLQHSPDLQSSTRAFMDKINETYRERLELPDKKLSCSKKPDARTMERRQ